MTTDEDIFKALLGLKKNKKAFDHAVKVIKCGKRYTIIDEKSEAFVC